MQSSATSRPDPRRIFANWSNGDEKTNAKLWKKYSTFAPFPRFREGGEDDYDQCHHGDESDEYGEPPVPVVVIVIVLGSCVNTTTIDL